MGLVFVAVAGPSVSGADELLALEGHIAFGVVVRDSRCLAKMLPLVGTRERDGATALGESRVFWAQVRILPRALSMRI